MSTTGFQTLTSKISKNRMWNIATVLFIIILSTNCGTCNCPAYGQKQNTNEKQAIPANHASNCDSHTLITNKGNHTKLSKQNS